MFEATPIEAIILEDVKQRTGLEFRLLAGIPTRGNKAVADMVLPILAEWPGKLTNHETDRADVYRCFHTPHAYPFLDHIVSWWTTEQHKLNLAWLTQTLALLVRRSDAERIWKLCGELPRRPFHYMLLSKLATCPEVEHQVKDVLVQGLETEKLEAGNLSYIGQVNDPRIRRWFEGQVGSPDANIRLVAKRVVAKSKKWPKGAEYSGQPPDRSEELFSTEVGLEDLRQLLAQLAKRFGFIVPAAIKTGVFLASAELNRWMIVHASNAAGFSPDLWFRLEDMDTVEVVLTKGVQAGSIQTHQ